MVCTDWARWQVPKPRSEKPCISKACCQCGWSTPVAWDDQCGVCTNQCGQGVRQRDTQCLYKGIASSCPGVGFNEYACRKHCFSDLSNAMLNLESDAGEEAKKQACELHCQTKATSLNIFSSEAVGLSIKLK